MHGHGSGIGLTLDPLDNFRREVMHIQVVNAMLLARQDTYLPNLALEQMNRLCNENKGCVWKLILLLMVLQASASPSARSPTLHMEVWELGLCVCLCKRAWKFRMSEDNTHEVLDPSMSDAGSCELAAPVVVANLLV